MKKVFLPFLFAGFIGSAHAQEKTQTELDVANVLSAQDKDNDGKTEDQNSLTLKDEFSQPQVPGYPNYPRYPGYPGYPGQPRYPGYQTWRCDAWSVYSPRNGASYYWIASNPYVARQQALTLCNSYTRTQCYYNCYRIN